MSALYKLTSIKPVNFNAQRINYDKITAANGVVFWDIRNWLFTTLF
jgi:hypothetical protein